MNTLSDLLERNFFRKTEKIFVDMQKKGYSLDLKNRKTKDFLIDIVNVKNYFLVGAGVNRKHNDTEE